MRFSISCIVFALLFSCASETKKEEKGFWDTPEYTYSHIEGTPAGNYYHPKYLHFKDITLYDKRFIEETEDLRKHSAYNDFQFIDEQLIINKKDTMYFPELPEMGREITLSGKMDGISVKLKIKRINYTSVDFETEMNEGKTTHLDHGRATLLSGFFLGDETEKIGDETYEVEEFSYHSSDNECFAYISIGKDKNDRYFGKLSKTCNGEIKDFNQKELGFLY